MQPVANLDSFARVSLAHLPTPLEPMDRLAAALGLPAGRLFVKRDDATGLAAGGNKVRKLEFLCADAVANGAKWLVTAGGPQSNHARATAAAARRLGLGCTLLLDGDAPSEASGNLVLDAVLGARIVWLAGTAQSAEDVERAIAAEAARLTAEGTPAYAVAVGGSVPLGALGYVAAADELRAELPELARVFVATGSAGTHAGLVAGLGTHELVQGVRVGTRVGLEGRIEQLAADTARLAGLPEPTGSPQLDDGQLGDGYAAHTEACAEAIALAARTEALILDPVYTGKAMAALIAAARAGDLPATGSIVYVHTGGMPGLLSLDHGPWTAQQVLATES